MKTILSFLIFCLSFFCCYGENFVVLDAKTGHIVSGKNPRKVSYPASLTKMMTLYLVFEALKQRSWTLKTPLRVSRRATQQEPCKLWIKHGRFLTVQQAILGLATRSFNDVSVVIAENLSGSVEQFARRMNQKARQLGLMQSFFVNPSGLHHPKQVTSPYDMACLLRALWRHFPEYSYFLRIPRFVWNGKAYPSTNKLLGVVPGIKMGKTGYTGKAGWNLATLTKRQNKEVIVVVLKAKSPQRRNSLVKNLIEEFYSPIPISGALGSESSY